MSIHLRDASLPLAQLEAHFPQRIVALASGASAAVRFTAASKPDAPVVVLLHGIGLGAASWLHVATGLASRARVIAWDAPGYGTSTPLAAEAPLAADYAMRLHELLNALQVERCVLVGHSLGALMAAAFASGPGRDVMTRLVLISPARGYGAAAQSESRQQVLATRLGALQRVGIVGMAQQAPDRMLSAAASPEAHDWVRWNAARLDPAGYTQAVQMLCRDELDRHVTANMPVEVHCGDGDLVTPPAACAEVARRFDAPFAPIAHAGHASPIEQPEAVARLIAAAAVA